MLRPGRLDCVIDVTAPDAEAAIKLVRLYGRESIDAATDLTEVGENLNGLIPAVIAEVVKRAKLTQMRLNKPGQPVVNISSEALLESAKTMRAQVALLEVNNEEAKPTIDSIMQGMFTKAVADLVENAEPGNHVLDGLKRRFL
jgi:transitional endoplasmic reticulum ATPase